VAYYSSTDTTRKVAIHRSEVLGKAVVLQYPEKNRKYIVSIPMNVLN
jgi:hypothetical protein